MNHRSMSDLVARIMICGNPGGEMERIGGKQQINKQTFMTKTCEAYFCHLRHPLRQSTLAGKRSKQQRPRRATLASFVIESNGATSSKRLQSTKSVMDRNRRLKRRLQQNKVRCVVVLVLPAASIEGVWLSCASQINCFSEIKDIQ